MHLSFEHLQSLAVRERDEVAAAADAFEDAWASAPDRPPDLKSFLPAGGRVRLAALVELACIDLELRLKRGGAARAEDYLARYPELKADPEAAWALVAAECRRRGVDSHAALEEYGRRFPHLTDRLRALLGGPAAPAAAPPAPPVPPQAADRNLLFGVLALQMDFIGRDDLIRGMNAWAIDKARPLGRILLEQGSLDPDAHALLDALVRKRPRNARRRRRPQPRGARPSPGHGPRRLE